MIQSPVLFLVFNRPEKTKRVFDLIRKVKPKKLYISADGPRNNVEDDKIKCDAVKKIISNIDWKCDAKFLFQEKNLGCSLSGKKAWDWIFSQEEEMIFIEDDGLVSESFFSFSQDLLNKYRYDNRIAYIYGDNYGHSYGNKSYFFSKYGGGTYSMATWKRVYDLYEYELNSFEETKKKDSYRNSFIRRFEYDYINEMFDSFIKKRGNTYDLQIVYLIHKYNMLNIIPNVNLVSNIGFDYDGSNTKVNPFSKLAKKYGNRPKFELTEITHPNIVSADSGFEKKYFKVRILNDKSYIISVLRFYLKPIFGPIYRMVFKNNYIRFNSNYNE